MHSSTSHHAIFYEMSQESSGALLRVGLLLCSDREMKKTSRYYIALGRHAGIQKKYKVFQTSQLLV